VSNVRKQLTNAEKMSLAFQQVARAYYRGGVDRPTSAVEQDVIGALELQLEILEADGLNMEEVSRW
jgi:hypothetical protein